MHCLVLVVFCYTFRSYLGEWRSMTIQGFFFQVMSINSVTFSLKISGFAVVPWSIWSLVRFFWTVYHIFQLEFSVTERESQFRHLWPGLLLGSSAALLLRGVVRTPSAPREACCGKYYWQGDHGLDLILQWRKPEKLLTWCFWISAVLESQKPQIQNLRSSPLCGFYISSRNFKTLIGQYKG